jgi:hypothetical protein
MNTRTAACAALLALTATLTACSSSDSPKADPAACKAAMTKQYKDAVAKGDNAPEGTRPKACEGVDDTTVQQFASDIMKDAVGDALSTPTAAAGPDITPECRKWIEGELTDSSDSINATAGLKACPGMDNDQLNAAIQTVTDEMLHSATATP